MIIPLLICIIIVVLWIGCVLANLIADRRARASRLAPRASEFISDRQHAQEARTRDIIFKRLGPPFNKPKANGNAPHHGRQSTKAD